MKPEQELKNSIQLALRQFGSGELKENSTKLFNTLGYHSNLTLELSGNGKKDFLEAFDAEGKFIHSKAFFDDWTNISLLFQLTADHITSQEGLFTNEKLDKQNYISYLFFAVELKGSSYSRGNLAQITREMNKLTKQPAMILFKHGSSLTLSVIDRRLHKRDEAKDVLEKVTLIKDISIPSPHRAHVEILFDLSLPELMRVYSPTNFEELHNAWRKTLDLKELNESFYKKLYQWYERALAVIEFPNPDNEPEEVNKSINAIRLLTRLIFCWFLKEKIHRMDKLFDKPTVDGLLNYSCPTNSNYYRAILQNLFFATLNVRINERRFRRNRVFQGKMDHYMDHRFYRYASYFKSKDDVFEELFNDIPFLNGGIFECLDHPDKDGKEVRVDCFSENKKNIRKLSVPDNLFFAKEKDKDKEPGLIDILQRYKFTIEENTPLEQEIALDPDLLGRTFESLLATYNPETKTTARNATGSFYTPREIVNYMVEESLRQYLLHKLTGEPTSFVPIGDDQTAMFGNDIVKGQTFLTEEIKSPIYYEQVKEKLKILFDPTRDDNPFDETDTERLIEAISNCKIVDPACGSGAYPMGILDRMVRLLRKLDKENVRWKTQLLKNKESETAKRIQQIETDIKQAEAISVEQVRKKAVKELEDIKQQILQNFAKQDADYLRKLYLIENCIYGVDIQSIAIEIAKLRFFLSLLVDFRTNDNPADNYGILPLPNLDYKLMQGNSLLESYGDVDLSIASEEKTLGLDEGTRFTSKDKEKLRELMHQFFEPANVSEKQKTQEKIDAIVERYVMNRSDALIAVRKKQLSEAVYKLKLAKDSKPSTQGIKEKLQRQIELLEREVEQCKQQLHDAHRLKKELLSIQHRRQKPYFLWHLYFMDVLFDDHDPRSGFDIVIGNPPYIQLQKDGGKLAEMFEDKGFQTYERTGDIYSLFYEQGFNVLKRDGVITYITSSQWQKASYGKSLRQYFLTKDPLRLLNMGPGVFDNSVVDTNILIARNAQNGKNLKGAVIRSEEDIVALNDNHLQPMNYVTAEAWAIMDTAKQTIEQKILVKGKPLKLWDVKINRGVTTGYNEAFIIDEEKKKELIKADAKSAEIIKPLLRGREIEKYWTEWDGTYLINVHNGLREKKLKRIEVENYPAIKKHLDQFKKELVERDDQGATPYNLRNCTYLEEFSKEKVIWKRIGSQLRFSYSDEEIYCLDSACIATGEKIKYLTALLNSKVCNYQLFEKAPRTGMGDLIISVQALEPILVYYPNNEEEKRIVKLVDQILTAKKKDPKADTSVLEGQIDVMVYKLYNLTYDEVKIVDPGFWMTKEEYEAQS